MSNHYIIPLFVAGSLLLTMFGFFLIAYLLVQKRKQNKYEFEKQQMVFEHQNSILRTRIEEQENTMNQLSGELHDNVKSVLGFAQMHLQRIDGKTTPEQQVALIAKTNAIIGNVIDELHNISHSLSSSFVKNIGLAETITRELEALRLTKNIAYTLEIKGTPAPLEPERELHVYRIAQEAMQNCVKHAKCKNINFMLDYGPGALTMKITDDGIGFDKQKIHAMNGLGFLNMFQRARYVQGLLDVQTAPMKGSSVVLTLNLDENGLDNQGGRS